MEVCLSEQRWKETSCELDRGRGGARGRELPLPTALALAEPPLNSFHPLSGTLPPHPPHPSLPRPLSPPLPSPPPSSLPPLLLPLLHQDAPRPRPLDRRVRLPPCLSEKGNQAGPEGDVRPPARTAEVQRRPARVGAVQHGRYDVRSPPLPYIALSWLG